MITKKTCFVCREYKLLKDFADDGMCFTCGGIDAIHDDDVSLNDMPSYDRLLYYKCLDLKSRIINLDIVKSVELLNEMQNIAKKIKSERLSLKVHIDISADTKNYLCDFNNFVISQKLLNDIIYNEDNEIILETNNIKSIFKEVKKIARIMTALKVVYIAISIGRDLSDISGIVLDINDSKIIFTDNPLELSKKMFINNLNLLIRSKNNNLINQYYDIGCYDNYVN